MTNNEIGFQAFIEQRLPLGSVVGPAELTKIFDEMGITDPDAVVIGTSALHEWGEETDTLSFSPSGWRIKLTAKLAQSAVLGASLGAALVQAGVTNIPTAVIAALLPVLFDFDRVKLTMKEEAVLVRLALYDRDRINTPEEWYQELPPDIRANLNQLDFLDILEKIVASGHGRRHDSEIEIYRSGKGRLALNIE